MPGNCLRPRMRACVWLWNMRVWWIMVNLRIISFYHIAGSHDRCFRMPHGFQMLQLTDTFIWFFPWAVSKDFFPINIWSKFLSDYETKNLLFVQIFQSFSSLVCLHWPHSFTDCILSGKPTEATIININCYTNQSSTSKKNQCTEIKTSSTHAKNRSEQF